jgi:hypothetical protein
MLLAVGQSALGNILHVICGPESDAFEVLSGGQTANITKALQVMDQTKPVFLSITRCRSEFEAASAIAIQKGNGIAYPYSPSIALIDMSEPGKGAKETQKEPSEGIGKCCRCEDKEAKLVPGLSPAICYNCVQIDLGLRDLSSEQ